MTATGVGRAALIAAVASLLAACGHGGQDGARGAKLGTLTKQQVVERGDELCRDARENVEPLAERMFASREPRSAGRALREIAREGRRMTRGLGALKAPGSGRRAIDRYVDGIHEQLIVIERAAESLEAGRVVAARATLWSGLPTSGRLEGVTRGYGFTVCGRNDEARDADDDGLSSPWTRVSWIAPAALPRKRYGCGFGLTPPATRAHGSPLL